MSGPDINKTRQENGPAAVRLRHDRAQKYRSPNGHAREQSRFTLVRFNSIKLSTSTLYLVKGIIPRVGITLVWGPPKCGKSFWLFDTLMHVALDWAYRGRKIRSGPVVYCALEGANGFKARAEAFRPRHLADHHADIPFFLVPARMDLVRDHPSLIGCIKAQIGDTAPVAVALDTLNRSLTGSESSDEDMAAYVRAADAIREAFGCAVIIIHHCGIEGSRPRGHSSLTGAVEAQIAVKRDASNNIITMVEWMKDGPEGDVIVSRLEQVNVGVDEDGDPITSCVVVPGDASVARDAARISGATKLALELLAEAILDEGQLAPANKHVPLGTKAVPVSVWRSHCYAGTVTDSDDPQAKRRAFGRASKRLQEIRAIGVWDDLVWIADNKSGTCGT